MPGLTSSRRAAPPVWLWALLPMLLAAALVVPAFTRDVFDVDEAATMIGAGARHPGPYSPAEAIRAFTSRWPDHPWGHVVAFALWGRLVGWSEFAVRVLPWLCGLLTIAWVYRLGRDLFSARIALVATSLLATSVLFLAYMHNVRPYSAAMLFAAIVLWGYWRVALCARPPGHAARLALVAGATGLLYAHYFAALLLPALGLFHLLFVRKNRRWWQPVLLLALAALFAAVQIPDLIGGIRHNQAKGNLHVDALHYPEVVSLLLRYLSSDLLNPRPPFNALPALALPLSLGIVVWRVYRQGRQAGAVQFLTLTAGFQLLLLIGANEWLRVMDRKRIRYLVTLWPTAMLLISTAASYIPRRPFRIAALIPIALIAFAGARDFHQEGRLVNHSWQWRKLPVSIPVTDIIAREAAANALLVVDYQAFVKRNRSYEFYTGAWGERRIELNSDVSPDELLSRAEGYEALWIVVRGDQAGHLKVPDLAERFRQAGWLLCRSIREKDIYLALLVSPAAEPDRNCPVKSLQLHFERDIELAWPEVVSSGGQLRVDAVIRSVDDTLLAHYSLAVHVIDPRSGERVAQGDVGGRAGTFVPVRSDVDISALPAGAWEVHVALYDWQTGERLNARNPETGEVSDMHVLHRFRIG